MNFLNKSAILFRFQDPFTPGVNFSLSLLLRRPPEVTPPTLLLYSHPENKATLNIHHGSGHFRVDHMTKTRPPPAEVAYSSETHQVTMTPLLSEGQIKVVVSDLCLEVERDVTVMVVVAGMFVVEVAVGDRVQVGNTTLAFVRVKDSQGSPFPASQLRLVSLCLPPLPLLCQYIYRSVSPSLLPSPPLPPPLPSPPSLLPSPLPSPHTSQVHEAASQPKVVPHRRQNGVRFPPHSIAKQPDLAQCRVCRHGHYRGNHPPPLQRHSPQW